MGYEFFVYAAVDILQKRTNGIVDLAKSPLCVEKNLSSPIVQPQSCILDTAILKGVEISPNGSNGQIKIFSILRIFTGECKKNTQRNNL